MKKLILAISIKRKKSKIVVFQIDKDKKILINEVKIVNKFIAKTQPKKTIKKLLKNYIVSQILVSTSNSCLDNIEKKLSFLKYEYLLFNELFIINEAIKSIDTKKLKPIESELNYIKNGWLNFSEIEHIDLNGLIHYKLNEVIK